MPYDYRKMTPAERAEVVKQRRERGYPPHAPPHPFRQEGCYLITAAAFEHANVMSDPARRSEFERDLLVTLASVGAGIDGWVVLPNHYHILSNVRSLDIVSNELKLLHGSTSRKWNLEDGLTGKRRVWYKFADRAIRDEAHYFRVLNYIHYNPVKHLYAEDVYAWPWSSLFLYYEEKGRDWLREIWQAHPPGDLGKDWDDF
jgi:putative transposase